MATFGRTGNNTELWFITGATICWNVIVCSGDSVNVQRFFLSALMLVNSYVDVERDRALRVVCVGRNGQSRALELRRRLEACFQAVILRLLWLGGNGGLARRA